MKTTFSILFLIVVCFTAHAQNACTGLKKYQIGNSGCFAHFGVPPEPVDMAKLGDQSVAYSTSSVCQGVTSGILLVKFAKPIQSMNREATLSQYMELAKDMANVRTCNERAGTLTHARNSKALGIKDECTDSRGTLWHYQGWVDENCAAILYVNEKALDTCPKDARVAFFDGFVFPSNL